MPKQQRQPRPLPSKDDLLAFIGQHAGKAGKREIARAFGIKSGDRIALKHMLRELADEGRLERRRGKLHHAGHLPSVVLADITGRDKDGELIAVPTEWDEEAHGPPPKIHDARDILSENPGPDLVPPCHGCSGLVIFAFARAGDALSCAVGRASSYRNRVPPPQFRPRN